MAKIPITFKRVAAAFDDATRWTRPCDSSSGSEYWSESGIEFDLSELVNSYIEKGGQGVNFYHNNHFNIEIDDHDINQDIISDGNEYSYANCASDDNDEVNFLERREMLQNLVLECTSNGSKNNGMKQKIFDEINVALRSSLIGGCNNSGANNDLSRIRLKRHVMAHLRDKGFDAGLCKSRWEKTRNFPAGTYEYIDVNAEKTRYIIEVNLAGEFEIARPTNHYTTLLEMIPSILIIENPQLLKQLMRLMTSSMRDSLKHANMHVAPWRRNGYLQAKYFSPYKRTINRESSAKGSTMEGDYGPLPMVSYYCRDVDFGCKINGVRGGVLGAVFQGI